MPKQHEIIEKSLPIPLSQAIRAGDFVFVSGTVPFDEQGNVVEGGVEEQTRVVLGNIAKLLKKAGSGLNQVIKTTVWLDDSRDFGRFNKTYAEFFPTDAPPARSTTRAELMIDVKVEIEAVAYSPKG